MKPSLVYFPGHQVYDCGGSGRALAPILKPLPGTAGSFYVARTCTADGREANWQRFVTLAAIQVHARKLIVGETINPPGRVPATHSHKRDTWMPEVEVLPMEEVYHYRFHPGSLCDSARYTIPEAVSAWKRWRWLRRGTWFCPGYSRSCARLLPLLSLGFGRGGE